jgi:arabinogalactan endo-1,4-beta-galactosidase
MRRLPARAGSSVFPLMEKASSWDHARFLAKRGVNMVRLHGHLEPKDKNAKLTDVDAKAIDEAWKLVAAMKKEGIYVTISPYWSANLKHVPAHWGEETKMTLTVKNPRLKTAKVLDSNGNATGEVKVVASAEAIKLNLPRDAIYVVLRAD